MEEPEVRIYVHPGYVTSKTDGDVRFVSFPELCKIYQVDESKAINAQLGLGRKGYEAKPSDRHLYPNG